MAPEVLVYIYVTANLYVLVMKSNYRGCMKWRRITKNLGSLKKSAYSVQDPPSTDQANSVFNLSRQ